MTEAEFEQAVADLQTMARAGSSLQLMLEFAKATIADRWDIGRALHAFRLAFDVPMADINALATWSAFSGSNPGVTGDHLEERLGARFRSRIRAVDDPLLGK